MKKVTQSLTEKKVVASLRRAEARRAAHEMCKYLVYVMKGKEGCSLPFFSRCDAAALDASKSFVREFPSHNLYRIGKFYTDTMVLDSEVNPILIKG